MSYENSKLLLPAGKNALSTRCGVAFDGTTSTRVYSTLTNQNIGTDAFSLSIVAEVPTTSPSYRGIFALSSVNTTVAGYGADLSINTTGALEMVIRGASLSDYNMATLPNFITNWGGRKIILQIVRPTTGSILLYINGVSQTLSYTTGGSYPGWQGTVTSTYIIVGANSSTQAYVCAIYSATLYNFALSQSDVTEINELNGGVPQKYKFGSQQSVLNVRRNSTFSDATSDWGHWAVGSVTISGGKLVSSGSVNDGGPFCDVGVVLGNALNSSGIRRSIPIVAQYDLSGFTGTGDVRCCLWGGTATQQNITQASMADGTYSASFNIQSDGLRSLNFGFLSYGTGTRNFTIDNLIVKVGGAVCHYDGDTNGVGYQWKDQSTNNLDATLTTTGTSWTVPTMTGMVRANTTGSGWQQLTGASLIPANSILTAWNVVNVVGGATTLTAGSATSSTRYFLTQSLSSTANGVKSIKTFLDDTADTTNLWVSSSNSNQLKHTIYYNTY